MRKATRVRHPAAEPAAPAVNRLPRASHSTDTLEPVAHVGVDPAAPELAETTQDAAEATEYVEEAADLTTGHEFGKLSVLARRGLSLTQPTDPEE